MITPKPEEDKLAEIEGKLLKEDEVGEETNKYKLLEMQGSVNE